MFKGSTLASIVGILVITSTYAPSLNAQCSIVSEGALDAPTFQPGAKLDTVAVQGNIATVTSRQADSVSVFKLEGGTWTFDAELTPSGGSFGYFGDSVAIGNDVILVGTPNDAVSRGAAYVFRRINDAWVETQKLEASEGYFFDGFGISIAIDGDTAVIGDSGMGWQAGTAYIFKDIAGTWTEVEKLNSATNTSQNLGFGTTVAIDGDTVVVGGPASGYDGLVAVFRNFGGMWIQIDEFYPRDPMDYSAFGTSVAIQDSTILVGAPRSDLYKGAVDVFEEIGGVWERVGTLGEGLAGRGDYLGSRVTLAGDIAVINSVQQPMPSGQFGSLFVYRNFDGAWALIETLTPDDIGDPLLRTLGVHFATDGEHVLVRSFGDTMSGNPYPPLAFRIASSMTDCNGNNVIDDCEIAMSPSIDCNGNGILDTCEILQGLLADCDGNGISDACEVETGADCNENGIPDACDIASQTSDDCDGNDIPDECDLKAVVELAREDNLDCVRHERFGHALAIDGQTALVAAYYPYSTIDATARVYERTNDEWNLVAELTPSNEPFYRAYGVDVALKNGIAVIGASTQDDIGAAYVFEEDNGTWSQVAKLSSNGLTDLPNFGARVACDGERILVSASEASTLGDNSGVVFVYERIANTWQEVAQLDTGVYEGRTRFGRNVAIQGNWAFISAYKIDGAGAGHPGVVHVFERVNGNWLEVDRLLSPSMRRATYFGYEVVTDGDTTVIGSLEEVGAGYDGAAYVYRRVNGSWQNVARLVGPNGEAGTKFGANVALSGNTIAVGASIADTQYGVNSGVTHIFREIGGNWRLVESLEPANGTAQQAFGQPAALDGNNLIVTAYNAETDPSVPNCGTGIVYFYDLDGRANDCDGNDILDACEAPLGTVAEFATALLNASNDPFDLCLFDGDGSGTLDGQDVGPFVAQWLAP